jgi:hypothetical protein
MSRSSTCLDNAAAESFSSHVQHELPRGRAFESVDRAQHETAAYLKWYNYSRIMERVGGLAPVIYRLRNERVPLETTAARRSCLSVNVQSPIAWRTSFAMNFSSVDERSVMAQEVGHIVPSSSFAAPKKVRLA